MLKYAFIIMSEGLDKNTYRVHNDRGDKEIFFAGVDNMDEAIEVVREFRAKGCKDFDLCTSFDDASIEQLAAAVDDEVNFEYVKFFGADKRKYDALADPTRLGVIIFDEGFGGTVGHELDGPIQTSIRIVDGISGAIKAARELDSNGIEFIELCKWFHNERTGAVIQTAKISAPIGTAGRWLVG